MRIESIKPGKRDKEKLVIRTECGKYISAHIDDAYTLKVGDEISEGFAAELCDKYDEQRIKQSAAKSLAHHSLSKSALSKKLREKGFSEEDSEKTADWFEEKGFIDDEAYARTVADYYKRRGYGKTKVKNEFFRRGVPKEIADDVIGGLGGSENEISALIRKKLAGKELTDDIKRKLVAFLLRRGFEYDEIRTAMNEMRIDTEDMV